MRKKFVDASEIGKQRIAKDNHHINTMVYRDFVGTFILVKGRRVPITDKVVNKKRIYSATWI